MKTQIEVIDVEHRSGRSKAGTDYSMHVCQCITRAMDEASGEIKPRVGELVLPKGHEPVKPGLYEGEFGIAIDAQKRIGGRLIKLTPISKAAAVPAAGASVQK